MGAGHADHVDLAGGNRMPGGGDILDLGGMEDGEAGRRADFACKIKMRRTGHALNGDNVGQSGVGVDMTPDDVEIVDQAALLQPSGDFDAFRLADAVLKTFIGGVTNPEDEIVANALAYRPEDVETEAHAVFKRAAIGAVKLVGQG
ncbi:hypothetical protein D3C80_536820 [compost metagenome]